MNSIVGFSLKSSRFLDNNLFTKVYRTYIDARMSDSNYRIVSFNAAAIGACIDTDIQPRYSRSVPLTKKELEYRKVQIEGKKALIMLINVEPKDREKAFRKYEILRMKRTKLLNNLYKN